MIYLIRKANTSIIPEMNSVFLVHGKSFFFGSFEKIIFLSFSFFTIQLPPPPQIELVLDKPHLMGVLRRPIVRIRRKYLTMHNFRLFNNLIIYWKKSFFILFVCMNESRKHKLIGFTSIQCLITLLLRQSIQIFRSCFFRFLSLSWIEMSNDYYVTALA